MRLDDQINLTLSSKYSSVINQTTTISLAASSSGVDSVAANDTIDCYELLKKDDFFQVNLANIASSCISCRKITVQAGEIADWPF